MLRVKNTHIKLPLIGARLHYIVRDKFIGLYEIDDTWAMTCIGLYRRFSR